MRKIFILLFAFLFPLAVLAQSVAELSEQTEDDRGFLTRLLEDNLSGAGRQVIIRGFEGALSSRATFEQITIADDDGTWLTLNEGAIQWNRSALLRGRIEIAELSASEILLPRLPGTGGEKKPQAEAREFALPELPVSVNIDKIEADRVELGEPVIGLPAAISVAGSMSLAGGEGKADLTINRLDGPRGAFVLSAGYVNETKVLSLNLSLDEAADGLLVNLIDLYDKPSVSAQISGEGPLDGFTADLRLATSGQPRVTGRASLTAEASEDGAPGRAFRLELGGDIASLLPPDDRTFFGPNTQLLAEGWRGDDGRLNVPVLMIDTAALNVSGSVATNPQGAPQSAVLLMTLGRDAGASEVPVKLPGGGDGATVESGRLELQYDAAEGEGWTLDGYVGQLDQGKVKIGRLTLDGAGQVVLDEANALSEITGALDFGARQMEFEDAGLAQAVGEAITGDAVFTYGGGQLEVSELAVHGADYGLSGYSLLSDLTGGLLLSLDMDARYQDLGRLSTLAGRPMSGRADASISGYYTILTKAFDIDARVEGNDISVDQEQLDSLLAGRSQIVLGARRDETGIDLRNFSVNAQRLAAEARGYLNSNSSDITAQISMPSLADIGSGYAGSLQAEAKLNGAEGERQLSLSGDAEDLKIGIDALDRALQGRTNLTLLAGEVENGYVIKNFQLANPQLKAEAEGDFVQEALDATANFSIPDLSVIQPDWSGDLDATAKLTETDGTRFIDLTGKSENLGFGQQGTDTASMGTTDLRVKAEEKSGVITLRDVQLTNDQINATAAGIYGEGVTDLSAKLDISSLTPLLAGWHGSLSADASLREGDDGARQVEVNGIGRDLAFGQAQVDNALAGETRLKITGTERDGIFEIGQAQVENPRLNASASGKVGKGVTDIAAALNAGDLSFLGNGISGSVDAEAQLVEEGGVRRISATGRANSLSVGQEKIDPVLRGQTSFDLAATQSDAGISLQRLDVSNPQLRVGASGNPAEALNIDARLNDLALIQPGFPGPVELQGTMRETAENFIVDLGVTAPGTTRLQIAGSAARDFSTTDIGITGSTNASIANSAIRTRSIEGPVTLDLRVNGSPSLEAVSGRVQLQGGDVAEPGLGIRIEGLDVTADLQNGRIQVDGAGNVAAGGRIAVSGPVDLRAGTLDIGVTLDNVVARDPNLYEIMLSGNVRMAGRNADGPLISGRIDVGRTEIRIPSTGLGGAKSIPDIKHVGDTRPPRSTRAKAGLEPFGSPASREAGLGGPPATPPANPPRLDLFISAPNQIFIRGRGVDAEMGGDLRVTGTTRNVIPIGHLELIRGRVDLLGKRFTLTEGLVEMQGSLVPVIRLVAETSEDGVTTRIIIDGEARDPDITFESSPEMPEEEVLSQLLFGRGLDNISPLQAAQLANAIAVLAGRAGDGIVGRLRNQVGLDDLDLATDDEGNVQVRAGKYLTDNVYTDVSVDDGGKSTLNLNLDISDTLRARGSVASDGESTIGVYFERDY